VGILVDFLKPWNFSDISQEYSLSAAESVILTLPDRVLHYDGTISTLVQILVDFLKALGFHHHQSILAVSQPESPRVLLSRIRLMQAATSLQYGLRFRVRRSTYSEENDGVERE
jgi:hypothetical protein